MDGGENIAAASVTVDCAGGDMRQDASEAPLLRAAKGDNLRDDEMELATGDESKQAVDGDTETAASCI
jgi:hypothetical protein